MFKHCLILLTAVLLASCAGARLYKPTPELLGANPATLRIGRISPDSNISDSSVGVYSHKVVCQKPGETGATITRLGFVEEIQVGEDSFGFPIKDLAETIQLPTNQKIVLVTGFAKHYFLQSYVCDVGVSFVPEPGAVYQVDRDYKVSFFDYGKCSIGLNRVVATDQGETLKPIENYRWGSLYAFQSEDYICDEKGNSTLKPPPPPKKKGFTVKRKKKNPETDDTEETNNTSE